MKGKKKSHSGVIIFIVLVIILIAIVLAVSALRDARPAEAPENGTGIAPSTVTERPLADLEIPDSTGKQSLGNIDDEDSTDREEMTQEDIVSALTPPQREIYDEMTQGDPQCEPDTEESLKSSGILALLYMKTNLTKEEVMCKQVDYAFYQEAVSGDKNAIGLPVAQTASVYADTMDTKNHTVEAKINGLDCTLSYTVDKANYINGLSIVKMDGVTNGR